MIQTMNSGKNQRTLQERGNDALGIRQGLPEALQVLVEQYPRDIWQAHEEFEGLVKFWMERHQMFRKLLGMLDADTAALLNGEMVRDAYLPRLARFGNMFVSELHMHHNIEDHHFFPALREKDIRIETGFDLLEGDHEELVIGLDAFTQKAQGLIAAEAGQREQCAEAFQTHLTGLHDLIDRHLTDEEDLIVPVILKYGANEFSHY